jgi:hypothetical protein
MKAMTANNGNEASVFAQYIDGPKEQSVEPEKILRGPLLKPIAPEATPQSSPTEKLLDWLINHWREDTISVRDICWGGPNSLRNRKSAINQATKILVENGWLAPIKSWRRDRKEWRIARGPELRDHP